MNIPAEYQAIRIWGNRLGSTDYYITAQQREACRDNAPLDAIYKDVTGRWVRAVEVSNVHARIALGICRWCDELALPERETCDRHSHPDHRP